jgi:glutamyl-tRNA synthetase
MREAQRARGEKTRYDGRWRPEPGKVLPPPPAGVKPVVRFRQPEDGIVTWDDLVKGPISIRNEEIDDLIILRPRAEDAPRAPARWACRPTTSRGGRRLGHGHHACLPRRRAHQQHALADQHLGAPGAAPLPQFGHCPMILGDDGAEAQQAPRRGQRHGLRRRPATCPRPCSTTWRAWAGATATTSCSRASRWCSGSTAATWPRARRSGTRPSWPGSTRTTSSRPTTRAWPAAGAQQLATRGVASAADDALLAACLRAVQGPLQHGGGAGRLAARCCSCRCTPPEADLAAHVTEAVRPALRALRELRHEADWDKAGIAAGDEGDAGRAPA